MPSRCPADTVAGSPAASSSISGHPPSALRISDRASNTCWRLLVRRMPGAKLHRPDGAGRSSASFQGGDFEGSKNLDPEKIRCGVNFPSGGIARICVGRHSGIDAHSDTWHQRAGADIPHGWSTFPTIICTGRTSMPIKSAGIVPELLREPSQEWSGGGWRAASIFLPRSEARPIRIPYNRSRANSARRELGRLIAPRRLAS